MLKLEDIKRPFIGPKFKPIEVLPMSFLESDYAMGHRRLIVFARKGLHCTAPGCERVGVHLIRTVDPGGGEHIDVYTKDFILMTVDHTMPVSKGGSDRLDNKEPMCCKCNSRKSDKVPLHLQVTAIVA
jgi:5-methylcytosine-specific restriction endonuclease McrA